MSKTRTIESSVPFFRTSASIVNTPAMNPEAVWPHSIELCITRVPIRKKDGYRLDEVKEFAAKLKNHMVKNGSVFLVCYAPTEDKCRPFEVAKAMVDAGFTHVDNIVVKKSWFPGRRSENNLANSHEYVLYFVNGGVWKLDRAPLREYMKLEDENACPGNTWQIETGSLDESYPIDLAELLIRMTDCLPGSLIFDPYCAGTASLRAAIKLGHSYQAFVSDKGNYRWITGVLDQLTAKNKKG